MSKYHVKCPMCGKRYYIELTDEQDEKLFSYRHKGQLIQEAFPELNKVEREFLKSGYCPDCQEMIFGNGETGLIKEMQEK